MKIKIEIEDEQGRKRNATLSFEEDVEENPAPKTKTIIDALQDTLFVVRDEILVPEPSMIGEIHMEKLHDPNDRCRNCNEQMWILLEVIEDTEEESEPDYPFIHIEHDLVAEVCIKCGRYRHNPSMVGSGIFGLLDEEKHEKIQDFLEELEKEEPEIYMQTNFVNVLLNQERLHMKAVYRLRARITKIRTDKVESQIVEFTKTREES